MLDAWPVADLMDEQSRLHSLIDAINSGQAARVYRTTYRMRDGSTFTRAETSDRPDLAHPDIADATSRPYLQRRALLDDVNKAIGDLDTLIRNKGG